MSSVNFGLQTYNSTEWGYNQVTYGDQIQLEASARNAARKRSFQQTLSNFSKKYSLLFL